MIHKCDSITLYFSSGRRDRSRSPMRGDSNGRRRDSKNVDQSKNPDNMPNIMTPMMMQNLYSQGIDSFGYYFSNLLYIRLDQKGSMITIILKTTQ